MNREDPSFAKAMDDKQNKNRSKNFSTTLVGVLLIGLLLLPMVPTGSAVTPPNLISYQGRLLDSNGVPLAAASANFQFRFYDAVAAGTCLWSNDDSACLANANRTVTLTDGLFSENLGDATLGVPYAAIPDSVFADNTNVWLEVEIEGEVLAPRKQIVSAAYALNSETLDGIDSSGFLLSTGDTATGDYDFTGAEFLGATPLVFEGASNDGVVSQFNITDPTGANVLTFQDGTGTVAFLSDIPAGAGVWTRAGTDLSPTTAGDDVLMGAGETITVAASTNLFLDADTSAGESTSATDSGGFLIGVFDEFANSASTNVQDVLDDLDAAITGGATGDITRVGSCLTGDCFDGTDTNSTSLSFYDGDSHFGAVQTANLTGARIYTLPDASGTVAVSATGPITLSAAGDIGFDQTANFTWTGIHDYTGATYAGASPLVFEGFTADAFESTFAITDPTGANVITFQDGTGTVAFLTDIPAGVWTRAGTDLSPTTAGDDVLMGAGETITVAASTNLFLDADTSAGESTSATDSGAFLIGVFDEFANSNATNVQDVLDDLDAAITGGATGDITRVGTCLTGDCFDGADTNSTSLSFYDGDSHFGTMQTANITGARTYTFPDASGTVAVSATGPVTLSAAGDVGFDQTANFTWTGQHDYTGAEILGASPFQFEGTTDDNIYTTFTITDPTGANVITFQDATGTVAFTSDIPAGVWTRAGTDLSPTTAGDDVLLNAGESITISDMTPGSVVFASTAGLLSQDNTNLFWDNTSKYLGIGDNTPAAALTVGDDTSMQLPGGADAVYVDGSLEVQGGSYLTGWQTFGASNIVESVDVSGALGFTGNPGADHNDIGRYVWMSSDVDPQATFVYRYYGVRHEMSYSGALDNDEGDIDIINQSIQTGYSGTGDVALANTIDILGVEAGTTVSSGTVDTGTGVKSQVVTSGASTVAKANAIDATVRTSAPGTTIAAGYGVEVNVLGNIGNITQAWGGMYRLTGANIGTGYALAADINSITGTAYGLYVDFDGAAATEYAAVFNQGWVGIGDLTPVAQLVVGSDAAAGFVAGNDDAYIADDLEVDGEIFLNNISLGAGALVVGPTLSGGYQIGVFDEFANSNATNVQDVLDDLDAAISGAATGDISRVGSCLTGDCFDGTDTNSTSLSFYDGDSHFGQLQTANLTGARIYTLPDASGTVAVSATGPITLSAAGDIGFDQTANFTWTGQHSFAGAEMLGASPFQFEGATDDNVYTTFTFTDPTGANVITFQDGTGTVAFTSDIPSAQNLFETMNAPAGTDPVADSATDTLNFTGTNITITGTAASDTLDFSVDDVYLLNSGDTATGDYDFTGAVYLGASPQVFEGFTADGFESTFAFTDPTGANVITFQDGTGTVAFLTDIPAGAGLWEIGANGTYEDDAAVIVGIDQAETLLNAGFTLAAGDLFVQDELGVEGNIYTDGSFIAGASLTMSDTGIIDSNSDINFTSTTDGFNFTFTDSGAGDDFIVDGNVLVVESDNDRVGIGTDSPVSPFHVSSSVTGDVATISANSTTTGNALTVNVADLTSGNGIYVYRVDDVDSVTGSLIRVNQTNDNVTSTGHAVYVTQLGAGNGIESQVTSPLLTGTPRSIVGGIASSQIVTGGSMMIDGSYNFVNFSGDNDTNDQFLRLQGAYGAATIQNGSDLSGVAEEWVFGTAGYVYMQANAEAVDRLAGAFGRSEVSDGTATTAYGTYGEVYTSAVTGTVSTGYGAYGRVYKNTLGTITVAYGGYFSAEDATTTIGVYAAAENTDQPSIRLYNADSGGTAQTTDIILGDTDPPTVAADDGSLYLLDTGVEGELWLRTGGAWSELALLSDIPAGAGLWEIGVNGTFEDDAAVIIGIDQAETLLNAGFTLAAGDLFVQDELGVEGNVYTDGSFIAGASLTLNDTGITDSNSDIDFTSTTDGFNFIFTGAGAGDDFIVDTNVLVVESDNDRVGIGTTSPGARLEVEIPNAFNQVGLLIDMDDTTNDPNAFVITNDADGDALNITNNGTGQTLDLTSMHSTAGNLGAAHTTNTIVANYSGAGTIGSALNQPRVVGLDAQAVLSLDTIGPGNGQVLGARLSADYSGPAPAFRPLGQVTGTTIAASISSAASVNNVVGLEVSADATNAGSFATSVFGIDVVTGNKTSGTITDSWGIRTFADGAPTNASYGIDASASTGANNYAFYTNGGGNNASVDYGLYVDMQATTNTYAAVFIDGDVGIGIATPGADLHISAVANSELVRLEDTSPAVDQSAGLYTGSAVPAGVVTAGGGSLFMMHDNNGTQAPELYLNTTGGADTGTTWQQVVTSSGGAITLDEAYTAGQTIDVDASGDLVFNLSSTQDFVIQDNTTPFWTFNDDDSIDYTTDLATTDAVQLTGNSLTTADLLQLSATNTGAGDVLQISGGTTTTANNFAINVTAGDVYFADDFLVGATSVSGVNAAFSLDGDDIFASGHIAAQDNMYADSFVAGDASTIYNNGYLESSGNFSIRPNSEADDYFEFSSDGTDLTLTSIGSSDITINATGGDTGITGNLDVSSHMAVGSSGAASTDVIVDINETLSGDSNLTGMDLDATLTGAQTGARTVNGVDALADFTGTTSSDLNLIGTYTKSDYSSVSTAGANTIDTAALQAYSDISNTGSVSTMYGLDIDTDLSAAGTAANVYGIRADVNNTAGTISSGAYGAYLRVAGANASTNYGVSTFVSNASVTNYGGRFQALGSGSTNYAVRATTSSSNATNNYAVYAEATGGGTSPNTAIYATASGGASNLSIYSNDGNVQFHDGGTGSVDVANGDGDVYIQGQLEIDAAGAGANDGVNINGSSVTTGDILDISSNSLTSGSGIKVIRVANGGSDYTAGDTDALLYLSQLDATVTSVGEVLRIKNSGGGATGGDATGLHIYQDYVDDPGVNAMGQQALVIDVGQSGSAEDVIKVRNNAAAETIMRLTNEGKYLFEGTLHAGQVATTANYHTFASGATTANFAAIGDDNDVMIAGDLELVSGALCIGGAANCSGASASTPGNAYADGSFNSTDFDLAERIPSSDPTLTPGEVVVIDTTDSEKIARSGGVPYEHDLVGVISTDPGFVLGWGSDPAVALSGRVPVRVSAENGPVAIGDYLTTATIPGYAMKATEAGMVLGRAMQEFNGPGTDVIVMFVDVEFYTGAVIGTDGTSTLVYDDVIFDNATLTIRGSGGIDTAVITSEGDVQLAGRLYPSDRGDLQTDKYIYYDGSAGPGGDMIRTNASGWSTGSYDFAEMFGSDEALEAGDVVVFDSNNGKVRRSTEAYDGFVAGIISTKPGFLAGENTAGDHPVALAGRVPVKVSLENGPIAVGDPLTTSSTAGYAMKATENGTIVGNALEAYDGNGDDKIIAFVNVSYYGGGVANTLPGVVNTASNSGGTGDFTTLSLGGNLYMQANDIIGVNRIAGIGDKWSIGPEGDIKTEGRIMAVIESYQGEPVEAKAVLALDDTVTSSGTGQLSNGVAHIVFEDVDPAYNDVISTIAPVRVMAIPIGEPVSLYIIEQNLDGFTIHADSNSNAEFNWFVTAYRKDHEPAEYLEIDSGVEDVVVEEAPVDVGASSLEEPPETVPEEEPVVEEPVVEEEPAPDSEPVVEDPQATLTAGDEPAEPPVMSDPPADPLI